MRLKRPILLVCTIFVGLTHGKPRQLASSPPLQSDHQLMNPFISPIIELIDFYSRKAPTTSASIDEPPSHVEHPNSVLRSFNLFPTTTTQTPDLVAEWFKSLVEPIRQEMRRVSSTTNRELNKTTRDLYSVPKDVRRAPLPTSTTPQTPLANLLEILGLNAKPKEEVQVGRDQTISVLGMPVGRRDGLMLSPWKGLSLGEQKMFGPIAVNDKYSVNWNFLSPNGLV